MCCQHSVRSVSDALSGRSAVMNGAPMCSLCPQSRRTESCRFANRTFLVRGTVTMNNVYAVISA